MSQQIANTSRPPTLTGLFLIFSRIGLTSFGGGLSGWLLREFVQDRDWIGEEDFLNGLAISDNVPANTSYVAGSIRLGTTALSDAADSDAGSYDGTKVAVALGTVVGGQTRTVTFKAIID